MLGTPERESPDACGLYVSDRYTFLYLAVYKAATRTIISLITDLGGKNV
jgi:hypothetical protein